MTFDQACQHVIRGSRALRDKPGHMIHYAASYASAGMGMTGREMQVQCLYILSNLSSWRSDHAKDVRETLKRLSKG